MTNSKTLQREIRKFIATKNWPNTVAVTLTLKQAINVDGSWVQIDDIHASGALKHFLKVLNRQIFGNGARRKSLGCLSVIEGGGGVRHHYHLLLSLPRDLSAEYLQLFVHRAIQKTKWLDVLCEVKRCDEGWLRYMTKLRTKQDFASSIGVVQVGGWQNSDSRKSKRLHARL